MKLKGDKAMQKSCVVTPLPLPCPMIHGRAKVLADNLPKVCIAKHSYVKRLASQRYGQIAGQPIQPLLTAAEHYCLNCPIAEDVQAGKAWPSNVEKIERSSL